MKYIYIIVCFAAFVSCKNEHEKVDTKQQDVKDTVVPAASHRELDTTKLHHTKIGPPAPTQFTSTTFKLTDGTFGYDILNSDGKKIIHQDRLPGLPGLRGFENVSQANCVAEMMIQKISKGIMPPSITIEELKHCGVKTE